MPDHPWHPFDPQGFAAYRLFMIVLNASVLWTLYAFTERLLSARFARVVIAIAATTPFLVHEVYFTWPKLGTAMLILCAAGLVLDRRPWEAGVVAALAYLVHPLALWGLPILAVLWVWRTRTARGLAAILVSPGLALVLWSSFNAPVTTQMEFIGYILEPTASLGGWVRRRIQSSLNTFVPLHLFLTHRDDPGVNRFGGTSPGVIVFFFQYWNALPFALGVVGLPVFLRRSVDGIRARPHAFGSILLLPLAAFIVYWGRTGTGLMREGLQVWTMALLILLVWATWDQRIGWEPRRWEVALLSTRGAETLAMLVVPTIATAPVLLSVEHRALDILSLAVMLLAAAGLSATTYTVLRSDAGKTRLEQG